MDIIEICKALSNETRVNIVKWLKNPNKNFPPQYVPNDDFDTGGGVCASSISKKSGISQPTVSIYLDILLRAGLLLSKRCGRWTYYRRNEDTIQKFSKYIGSEL